jgi:hypothetical protein
VKSILFFPAFVLLSLTSIGYSDSSGFITTTSVFTGAKFYSANDFLRFGTFRNDFKGVRPIYTDYNLGLGRAKAINENITIGFIGNFSFINTNEGPSMGFGIEASIYKIGSYAKDLPKFPYVKVSISKGFFLFEETNLCKTITLGIHNFAQSHHIRAIHNLALGITVAHMDFLYFGLSAQTSLNFSKRIKARRLRKG